LRYLLGLIVSVCWAASPVKIVLVAGKPSHGPGAHEFNAGTLLLEKCLRQNKGIQPVVIKGGWPEDDKVFDGARAIVLYMDGGARHPMILNNRLDTLRRLMAKGVGLACIHYAVEVPKETGGPELLDWIGGYYERPYSTNPINDAEVMQASPKHPISRGWKSFSARDEFYYRIRFRENDRRVIPILTTMLPKDAPNRETIAWAVERADGGRGFGFTGGHFHENWGQADFRRMVVNAILWTAKVALPPNGARYHVSEADLKQNLDDKPAPKKSSGN
jgi:type 1 glutamine amidotransferase